MTAPARTARPAAPRTEPEHLPVEPQRRTRTRNAAAERAYAKRAQRQQRQQRVRTERTERPVSRSGSASRATFVVLVMSLLVAGVAATMWLSSQATADSYRLEQAKKNVADLSNQADDLQRKVDQQDSAPSLAQRAAGLGMVPANDPAVLVVGPHGSVSVVGTPSVAQKPAPPPSPPASTTTPAPPPSGQQGAPPEGDPGTQGGTQQTPPLTTTPPPAG